VVRRSVCVSVVALALSGLLAVAAPFAAATGNGNGLDRIAQSGQALLRAGTARFAGRISITGSSTTSGTAGLSGAFDFTHRSGQFNINAGALGATGASGRLTIRLIGNVAYLSVGSFRRLTHGALPRQLEGKQWLRLDLSTLGATAGELEQANPASSLDFLRGATNSVENLGTERVSGVPATHYRIEVDLTQALEKVPANQRSQLQATLGALGGASQFPADVWLDAKGRPVKFSFEVTGQGATPTHISETFQYSDFGTPVRTPVPPSSQVLDFTTLLHELGRSLGGAAGATIGSSAPAA
jgi:hypothetical protein